MTVQIGLQGIDNLIGGVVVAAFHYDGRETDYASAIVPVEHFQGENYIQGHYLTAIADTIKILVDKVQQQKSEVLQTSHSFLLTTMQEHLEPFEIALGYVMIPEAELTQRLEADYLDYLTNHLGLSEIQYEPRKNKAQWFQECLLWLKNGTLNEREANSDKEKLVKNGWSFYPLWVNHPYDTALNLIRRRGTGILNERVLKETTIALVKDG